MAVVRSTENIPEMSDTSLGLACSLCEKEITNLQDCLTTKCNHIFHKLCITEWLNNSTECPNCKKLCHERDLLIPGTKSMNKNFRGRGRGSATKRYHTRSQLLVDNDNISQITNGESQKPLNDQIQNNNINDSNTPLLVLNDTQESMRLPSHNPNSRSNRRRLNNSSRRPDVDYGQISRMINFSIQQAFANLNMQNVNQPLNFSAPDQPAIQVTTPNIVRNNNSGPNALSQNIQSNIFHMNPDKVTSTIQSWNVRFDGSLKGLRCEEFIYRISCLTNENFNGNFDCICRNLHIVLTGKAKEWYWRYHKSIESIDWESFCAAFRRQYKDFRSSFDIREELHSRKQKPNESFESFYDAINEILDQLQTPLHDQEIIEIISRNLRPEIRHELLYVDICSLAELKKLCLKREKLLNEDVFKRNNTSRGFQYRRVAAVEVNNFEDTEEEPCDIETLNAPISVNALHHGENIPKCWNCEEEGHVWDMCVKERRIFCYGCGLKNVYKPQCANCSKNLKISRGTMGPHHRK